jgi:signal transduction histidine kinase
MLFEEKCSQILDKVFSHYIIMDGEYRILRLSPYTLKKLKRKSIEVNGQPISRIIPENKTGRLKYQLSLCHEKDLGFIRLPLLSAGGKILTRDFSLLNIDTVDGPVYFAIGPRKSSPARIIASERRELAKELRALYQIERTLRLDLSVEESIIEIADIIAKAVLHPQQVNATIRLDRHEYSTSIDPHKEFAEQYEVKLLLHAEKRGFIQVSYPRKDLEFLSEEKAMLTEISHMVSREFERREISEKLNRYTKRLEEERTKEKELQQQLMQSDRLASLGQLVSGIAHEINNPNTFIQGNISIISEAMKSILPILDEYAEKQDDFQVARLPYNYFRDNILTLIEDVTQGTERIKNIVNDLRTFARRDEGLLSETVDINKIINSSIRLVQNQVKRVAEVEVELQESLPSVRGNSQKLEQVLVNIFINASHAIHERSQASERKKGHIWVKSYFHSSNIWITVRDDGTGMSEPTRKRIFDPFFSTKKARQGTGLGLSIAYGIVEEHKGEISVESQLEHGSTFTIRLPAQ